MSGTLHLIKMAAGCTGVDDLRERQERHWRARGAMIHQTRHRPKRAEEILDGGSIYWVMAGAVRMRQPILSFETGVDGEGQAFCGINLAQDLIETRALPWRAFQGWRYLSAEDAPADLLDVGGEGDELPAALQQELRQLGLI